MSFEPGALFFSFAISLVGMGLLAYGKKQSRLPQIIAGLLFMVYPYFTPSLAWMAIVGVVITAALWWALWMGW